MKLDLPLRTRPPVFLLETFVFLALGIWLYLVWTLREHLPPVWPDEALFAEPALRLLQRGELATDQLAGLIPGMGEHTFWIPPVYLLSLSGVFSVFGVGLLQVRLSSLVVGVFLLWLLYLLGRRARLGSRLSLLPVALVALEPLYIRASLVGRMDGLCLALSLTALWLQAASSSDSSTSGRAWRRARAWAVGLLAGLSAMTHPMGVATVFAVLITSLLHREEPLAGAPLALISQNRDRRGWQGWRDGKSPVSLLTRLASLDRFAWISLGIALVSLPWLLWGLMNLDEFTAQLGAQFLRKSGKAALETPWQSIRAALQQSGAGELWMGMTQLLGLAGLVGLARRRPGLWSLVLAQMGWILLVIGSREMWYPAYLLPLAAIGIATFIKKPNLPLRREALFRLAIAALAISLVVGLSWRNARRDRALFVEAQQIRAGEMSYETFCGRISDALPEGSGVLLAVIPDPWLGLQGRSDLRLRQFAPEGLGVSHELWLRALRSIDRIITGRHPISSKVEAFLKRHGTLEAEVGSLRGQGAYARIYRVDWSGVSGAR